MNVFNILNNTVKELAVSRFKESTLVQDLVIPEILEGNNVLAIAGTGLGKTEAAMLPLFNKLIEKEHKPISLLYITPLKALNRDMFDRLLWWCNKLGLDASVRHGDTTQRERKLQVEHPPHILITTPEQIQAMLTGKRLRKHLENIRYIVIDEIHELVDNKRGIQLTLGLERLKQICSNPQIIALSATIGSPEKAAKFIFGSKKYKIIKAIKPKDIEIIVESPFPKKIDRKIAEKIFLGSNVAARLRKIQELIKEHRSALTFTNTREAAEVLSSRLRILDKEFPHEVHHSSLSKEVRIKAEKEFKSEKLKALIATSSLELGIDIGSIDLVLQYMSPRQVTKLVQRVGRSGHRIGRISKGIIISADGDDIFESAVISRKALMGELEPLIFHKNSLDVLAHQIIGLLMFNYKMKPEKIYEIIKSANPFSELSERDFWNVILFLKQLRLIWIDEKAKEIKRTRKVFDYYFSNLSVIPDSRSYSVIDTASNTAVGSLDEEFIASHGEIGSSFIVRGRPWRIISIDKNMVFVDSIDNIESAIPAWEGELIPVPFEVAQEVGKLRNEIAKLINKKLKNNEISEKIMKKYPVTRQTANKMISLIKKHIRNYQIPNDKIIMFEDFGEYSVMHCLFGTKVNETLSRFISTLLSAEYGEFITTRTDPYRIIFKNCKIEDIKKIIFNYRPEDIRVILEKSLSRSSLFKWRFIHIAKRFGAISKTSSFDKINIDRLIDVYWNSPIFIETLKELFTEKLDLNKSKEILKEIQDKKIKIIETKGLSPIAKLGFRYELSDVVKPERPEKEIYNIFKKRLLNTKVRLLCINCGKYSLTKYVKDVEREPRCRKCQSRLISILRPYERESEKIIKKRLQGKDLTNEELKKLERIKRSADLTIVYGKKAAIVLAGRGIGPQTASRILARMHKNENMFFRDILNAERQFIKTKKFWSD
ncbi:MAG: DEAD/DEAH box helicase [Candidatus Aenigmatarchaeota archaeon]